MNTPFKKIAKTLLLLIVFYSLTYTHPGHESSPQKPAFFGGGMAMQTGYVSIENDFGTIKSFLFGLGGRLYFNVGKALRLGGAGASVKCSYEDPGLKDSYVRIGYGGITGEASIPVKAFRFSFGLLVGGASYANLHIISKGDANTFEVVSDQRSTFVLSPIATVERSLTQSLSLMLMVDYLWGPDLGDQKHLGGPKVHMGVLFNK